MDENQVSKDGNNSKKDKDRKGSNPRGRPKGLPKTGGRKKKNVPTVHIQKWEDLLNEEGFVIPIEAMKLFNDPASSNSLKFIIA